MTLPKCFKVKNTHDTHHEKTQFQGYFISNNSYLDKMKQTLLEERFVHHTYVLRLLASPNNSQTQQMAFCRGIKDRDTTLTQKPRMICHSQTVGNNPVPFDYPRMGSDVLIHQTPYAIRLPG